MATFLEHCQERLGIKPLSTPGASPLSPMHMIVQVLPPFLHLPSLVLVAITCQPLHVPIVEQGACPLQNARGRSQILVTTHRNPQKLCSPCTGMLPSSFTLLQSLIPIAALAMLYTASLQYHALVMFADDLRV